MAQNGLDFGKGLENGSIAFLQLVHPAAKCLTEKLTSFI